MSCPKDSKFTATELRITKASGCGLTQPVFTAVLDCRCQKFGKPSGHCLKPDGKFARLYMEYRAISAVNTPRAVQVMDQNYATVLTKLPGREGTPEFTSKRHSPQCHHASYNSDSKPLMQGQTAFFKLPGTAALTTPGGTAKIGAVCYGYVGCKYFQPSRPPPSPPKKN